MNAESDYLQFRIRQSIFTDVELEFDPKCVSTRRQNKKHVKDRPAERARLHDST